MEGNTLKAPGFDNLAEQDHQSAPGFGQMARWNL
jgi:hypothetical protein